MSIERTSRGYQKIEVNPPEGNRLDLISINWCDKTTWYPQSVEVLDETLTDSGDGLTFNPATARAWIDVTHGKLTGEYALRTEYQPIIEVDDIQKTEDSPDLNDNDYSINYLTGDVVFNSSQSGKTVVAKHYHYQNGSEFVIAPAANKVLILTEVEVQFSQNIILNDTVLFQLYVGGSPYGDATVYQTMMDYVNEATGSYPQIPQMGGTGWRGLSGPLHIFRWPYLERATTDLKSSLAMQIKICLESDAEFGGDVAVATFYGKSEAE